MTRFALLADRVLIPNGLSRNLAVVVEGQVIAAIIPAEQCPQDAQKVHLTGDLMPGFIDLQVNGGDGVLFNDTPTVEGIAAIAKAHRAFGTTGLLPTLISDDLDVVHQAIMAVDQAISDGVPGILGIHLEGPFLNAAKKGIHDGTKIRELDSDAIDLISSLKHGKMLVTLAPERTSPDNIRELVRRGVVLAAGHTAATYEETLDAVAYGVSGFTHLFNAMPALDSRAPGVVGGALDTPESWCSIIADGYHVHPAVLRLALAAKGTDKLVLVTDAMPSVGSSADRFMLGGREITVRDGKCVSADGTLAGAHLDMALAVRKASAMLKVPLEQAVGMASTNPAAAIGLSEQTGSIRAGLRADFALLDNSGTVTATWIGGIRNET